MPSTTNASLRLPPELRKQLGTTSPADAPAGSQRAQVFSTLRAAKLNTVCEEARCPNLGECFAAGTATFMILGDRCTRRCHFCNVTTGRPRPVDADEPQHLAEAAAVLGLSHVVLTSVDRDELADKGAGHWAACIRALRQALPAVTVEVLTPDFGGDLALVDAVLDAEPHVFNHNIETVARLYKAVRPQSDWQATLKVLRHAATRRSPALAIKSGMMVGLGETDDEVMQTLQTLSEVPVDIATIGQYLRPSMKHWPVQRYVEASAYARFEAEGRARGIGHVFAGAFVRSSYHAGEAHAAHLRGTRPARVLPVLP